MDFWGIPMHKAALIVGNLVVLETLVSVDNAAVLASMVMRLPPEQRGKALKFGLIGAYVFRGLCLLLAGWILHIWWIKPIGGAYLLYMAFRHFAPSDASGMGNTILGDDRAEPIVAKTRFWAMNGFWWTVLSIELMDLAFSVDNVLVAVAYADPGPRANAEQRNAALMLLYTGVFIGILAMRFVAQYFVGLMQKYPRLEHSAYLVIGLLGFKLCLGGLIAPLLAHIPFVGNWIAHPSAEHWSDLAFSVLTLVIFAWPVAFPGANKGVNHK
jgi:YkoY family integral membrane protein